MPLCLLEVRNFSSKNIFYSHPSPPFIRFAKLFEFFLLHIFVTLVAMKYSFADLEPVNAESLRGLLYFSTCFVPISTHASYPHATPGYFQHCNVYSVENLALTPVYSNPTFMKSSSTFRSPFIPTPCYSGPEIT